MEGCDVFGDGTEYYADGFPSYMKEVAVGSPAIAVVDQVIQPEACARHWLVALLLPAKNTYSS